MKNRFRVVFFLLSCSTLFGSLSAQDKNPGLTISGKVIGDNTIVFNRVMIVNKTSGSGTFVGLDGNFSIRIARNDTLMFAYNGYKTTKICFRDSVGKTEFLLAVKMDPLSYQLKEISIYPVKQLADVQKEIETLEARKKTVAQLQGINTIVSPITALYERFSRLEQSKRKVAEMENEDMKRDALKDLLRIYVKYEIFDLSSSQFDDFITFCDLSDYYIVHATQYDLVETMKAKFVKFNEMNDYVRHKH